MEAARPLLYYKEPAVGGVDLRIAADGANLARDGDGLQFGIGIVPCSGAVHWSTPASQGVAGMVTQAVQRLNDVSALDPDARITSAVALGDGIFYDFVVHHKKCGSPMSATRIKFSQFHYSPLHYRELGCRSGFIRSSELGAHWRCVSGRRW